MALQTEENRNRLDEAKRRNEELEQKSEALQRELEQPAWRCPQSGPKYPPPSASAVI
jgi:hypothetical protein